MNTHAFTENAPIHAVPVSDDYNWDEIWHEEQKLAADAAAWDMVQDTISSIWGNPRFQRGL